MQKLLLVYINVDTRYSLLDVSVETDCMIEAATGETTAVNTVNTHFAKFFSFFFIGNMKL